MMNQVRQRATTKVGDVSKLLDVKFGGPEVKENHSSRLRLPTMASLISKRNAIYAFPIIFFLYIFGPILPFAPKAAWVYVSTGFQFDLFVGRGIKDLVDSMVVDPHRIFHYDLPPTGLPEKRDIFLKEFEHYRKTHPLPIISELDPDEEGHLDTEGVWKTLFIRSGGHNTCAAEFFPETVKAVDESPFQVLSIMFSRLAPGQVIPPHTGYTKIIQLYHMGLKVPKEEPKPSMTAWECEGCPKQRIVWAEGEEFVFDDSFVHEATNPNTEERIILFLHIRRIDLKGWRARMLSNFMHWIFTLISFAPASSLVEGTEKSCATLL